MEYSKFIEFKENIIRGKGKHPSKIHNSWGVYDVFKHIRKNKWYNIGRPVTEKEFYAIIRGVNNLLANEIALGHNVIFPERMGRLELRKHPCNATIKDGKLKVTYPIDWDATLKLWFEDEEAKENKTLVRRDCKERFRVKYVRRDATYNNKTFYEFALNRFLKRALKENILNGITDTIW